MDHYTTQEYLERTWTTWFPNVQTEITTTGVSYLSFDIFGSGFCQTNSEFEERLRLIQFFDYAAKNWGHHAREVSTLQQPLDHAMLAFLQNRDKVEASSQGLLAIKRYEWKSFYGQEVPRMITGLHLAAYFGVKAVVQLLLDTGMVQADSKMIMV